MKVAIVHDYLNQYGGAEKVVEVLHEIYPEAPIFTSIFLPKRLPSSFSTYNIKTSFMQKLPLLEKHFKKYLLLYPFAIESFDFRGFDVILSSSSAFAKGARVPAGVCHICYCYSPMRFVWDYDSYIAREELSSFLKFFLPYAISGLKRWDLKTVNRVNYFVAISKHIQRKIKTIYERSADIIYPPVDLSQFYLSAKTENYFIVVSRLNAYKRIDLVIEAFNRLEAPLIVIGEGPLEAALKRRAKQNITFLGKVSQPELARYLSLCRGFIFPGEEDFGIAPVEAMASGRPVIAYGAGGALETVIEGVTGLFFREQTVDALVEAVHHFEKMESRFNSGEIRRHAERFDKEIFKSKMQEYIKEKYGDFTCG